MPGPITHLKAAYEFAKRTGNKYALPALYLGSICPDSVNINGHAPKFVRWSAHLRNEDLDVWLCNANMFYRDNIGRYDASYLVGYIIHIVTDIVWDREFDVPLCKRIYEQGVSPVELKHTRWQELYGWEQQQINMPWFRDSVLKDLSNAKAMDIGSVKSYETEVQKTNIVELRLDKGRTPQLIDDGLMERFFECCCRTFDEIFK